MSVTNYDVVVIGSGPGGYIAAARAAQLGLSTGCIEKNATVGGTCLNVGCIPSKALLQSTEYYDLLHRHLAEHGVAFDHLSYDFSKMMRRKEEVVKSLVDSVAHLLKRHHVTLIKGTARFLDAHTLEICDDKEKRKVASNNFIVATGSEVAALPFLPIDEQRVLSSTGALALQAVPGSLLVIGAGAIGLEMASVYNRLGCKVVVVEMLDRAAPAMDQAISKGLLQSLKKQGIEFFLSSQVLSASVGADSIELEVLQNNQKSRLSAEKVLVAIGRRPSTAALGLQDIGVKVNGKGFIEVDANFRSSLSHIYAIGDVIEGPMLAHKASEEGRAAAEIIAGKHPELNYMAIPNIIYTQPEAASVGLTEQEVKETHLDYVVGISYFKGNARARCSGNTEGFVKVLGEVRTGRLLGMHILGGHASEMIQAGVYAMQTGMTLEEMAAASHAHPTLAEAISDAVLQALGRAMH